ncbi:MAG TPA: hypothetical protein VFB66_26290 [Tepidisphaeraceae bacterium]|nr:hypothetical protein [Tepidisphaeraceae bacterium]
MRVSLVLLTILGATPVIAPTAAAGALAPADLSPVERARALLYTDRSRALDILEAAARSSPNDTRVWAEYVNALDVDRFDGMADRAIRHALRANPRDPTLLFARARFLGVGDGAALDVLSELATVPGYERIAPRLFEWVSLWLSLPHPAYHPPGEFGPDAYPIWADRLIAVGRVDRAAAVIEEGLARGDVRDKAALRSRLAVVRGLQDRFDEAVAEQKAAGFPPLRMEGGWFGAPDVLLAKAKPRLAVAALGNEPPGDVWLRRLRAVALVRDGDAKAAAEVVQGDEREDRLILLRVYLALGQAEPARELGWKIVEPLHVTQGSYAGPWLSHYEGPLSLSEEYLLAVRWLVENFPQRRRGIEHKLGTGREPKAGPRPIGWSITRPMSEVDAELEAQLARFDPQKYGDAREAFEEEAKLRRTLSRHYATRDHFDAAAAVLEPLLARGQPPTMPPLSAEHDAVHWSILRRQAVASRAAEADYWAVGSARPLLAAADAAGLIKLGPAVLADVFDRLGPNTISGNDRRPWVSVVRELGSEQDAPVLVATVQVLARDPGRRPAAGQNENDRLSQAAASDALEGLTGRQCPATEPAARAEFWGKWWRENRNRIVRSVATEK